MTNKAPFCASLRLTRTVFTRLKIKVRPTGLNSFAFYILIFDFSLHPLKRTSTKVYVRKNNLFMQNEPKFQKVKMNVNKVLTINYVQMDTWSIRKNEPKTNPNEPKTNPIKANKMPKQTQNKPNPPAQRFRFQQRILMIYTNLKKVVGDTAWSEYLILLPAEHCSKYILGK
jgi:hypothetical protein